MSRTRKRDVPWLEPRPDTGIYYAHWYDPEQRRVCRESMATKDPAIASRRFGAFLVEGPKATRAVGDAGVTVNQVCDWYDHLHVMPAVTDKDRQRDAMAHLRGYFGDTPVKDVGVLEGRAYVAARRKGEVKGVQWRETWHGGPPRPMTAGPGSDSTIRRELSTLLAASALSVKFERLKPEHLPRIELPREERDQQVMWLPKDQVRQLLATAKGPLRDWILLAYYTGARRRAIENLRKDQVNLRQGFIDLHDGGPRTKKRKPIVPLYAEIRPTVERLMDSPGDRLFGGQPNFYRPFVQLAASLGIDAHPHMLRHSRATHMLMDGESPYKVAKLLGDTLKTLERVYAHCSVAFLETTSNVEVA